MGQLMQVLQGMNENRGGIVGEEFNLLSHYLCSRI